MSSCSGRPFRSCPTWHTEMRPLPAYRIPGPGKNTWVSLDGSIAKNSDIVVGKHSTIFSMERTTARTTAERRRHHIAFDGPARGAGQAGAARGFSRRPAMHGERDSQARAHGRRCRAHLRPGAGFRCRAWELVGCGSRARCRRDGMAGGLGMTTLRLRGGWMRQRAATGPAQRAAPAATRMDARRRHPAAHVTKAFIEPAAVRAPGPAVAARRAGAAARSVRRA